MCLFPTEESTSDRRKNDIWLSDTLRDIRRFSWRNQLPIFFFVDKQKSDWKYNLISYTSTYVINCVLWSILTTVIWDSVTSGENYSRYQRLYQWTPWPHLEYSWIHWFVLISNHRWGCVGLAVWVCYATWVLSPQPVAHGSFTQALIVYHTTQWWIIKQNHLILVMKVVRYE